MLIPSCRGVHPGSALARLSDQRMHHPGRGLPVVSRWHPPSSPGRFHETRRRPAGHARALAGMPDLALRLSAGVFRLETLVSASYRPLLILIATVFGSHACGRASHFTYLAPSPVQPTSSRSRFPILPHVPRECGAPTLPREPSSSAPCLQRLAVPSLSPPAPRSSRPRSLTPVPTATTRLIGAFRSGRSPPRWTAPCRMRHNLSVP